MDETSNALDVSVREANEIMFKLYDESEARWWEIDALEDKLAKLRAKREVIEDEIKAKRGELKAAGMGLICAMASTRASARCMMVRCCRFVSGRVTDEG